MKRWADDDALVEATTDLLYDHLNMGGASTWATRVLLDFVQARVDPEYDGD